LSPTGGAITPPRLKPKTSTPYLEKIEELGDISCHISDVIIDVSRAVTDTSSVEEEDLSMFREAVK
jgi:hypothetical protein